MTTTTNYSTAAGILGEAPSSVESEAVLNAMVAQPTDVIRLVVRALVANLKAAGVWAKLDLLYILPVHDEQASRLNWITPGSYTAVAGVGQEFLAYQGWKGTGVTGSYLDTGFGPTTAPGAKFVQDSAFMAIWNGTEVTDENKDDCGNTNNLLRARYSGQMAVRLNCAATQTVGKVKSGVGLAWANRNNSANFTYGHGATTLGTATVASATPGSTALRISAANVVPGGCTKRAHAFIAGGALTTTEIAALHAALSPALRVLAPDTYTLSLGTTHQVIDGIGFELQSDSIEGDSGGIQESNTRSLPLGLSESERIRFAQNVVSIPGGGKFDNFRLAAGLYWRGVTADGKNYREKYTGQNAAIAQMCALSGTSIYYTHWSPAPFWKKITVGATPYRGSTRTIPDKVADPTGWNTYLRDMLQGGELDAPDKASDAAGYAAWMSAFAAAVLSDMEYVHTNLGRVSFFGPQNEPQATTGVKGYPNCKWTDEQYYDFLKVIVPRIRSSTVLGSYQGRPNSVRITVDSFNGQTGVGAALILADPALLAEIHGWSKHRIDQIGGNSAWVRENSSALVAGTGGKPAYSDENEYFDKFVDPANADYLTPAFRFANTCMMPLSWFVHVNSPLWWWIHIGKDSDGPAFEREGRALTTWRPLGSSAPTDYPSLAAQSFDYIKSNWNAIKPWIKFLPSGSVRVSCVQDNPVNNAATMAWRKPDGRLVVAFVNRRSVAHTFVVNAPGVAGSLSGFRYDVANVDVSLGSIAVDGSIEVTVPPYSAEFWEGEVRGATFRAPSKTVEPLPVRKRQNLLARMKLTP